VSADPGGAAIAEDGRAPEARPAAVIADAVAPPPSTAAARGGRDLDADPIRVAIIGATGYVGAELIRILARHPAVSLIGLVGRDRHGDPVDGIHPHLATTRLSVHAMVPDDAEAVFLALPHGVAAERVPELVERGLAVIDLGPDFRLRDPAAYPAWYHFEHPRPDLLAGAVYGLPELHRAELVAVGRASTTIVGVPGCYPTATTLALAPLARAGLIGDLVVDAKSGVSGAGRDPKAELHFGEVNESIRAYGLFTHRHTAEIEQELATLSAAAPRDAGPVNPGASAVDFLPHLVPMTRGILSACHVRPTRAVTQPELDALYEAAYGAEPFVSIVASAPATKQVTGSNEARVYCGLNARTGRILAIGVIDNLVKGAAGQAVQAFNVVHGLPETAGLMQLPLAP
jgi:N-acetyl-gamma-glutamyl-phosphate reductase